jgi:uncharacterized protein (DUF4213/DUF364 family)
LGLAMSPAMETGVATRSLPWSGTLAGRPLSELAGWVRSWQPFEATIGMAAVNAAINPGSPLSQGGVPLESGNLAVFDHFLPLLAGKRVVVVGRYPGLERYGEQLDMSVLERSPSGGDLPDPAAEYLLPEADWVFLTASSITNKTFPRLVELSRDANLVLMGPTTPWLPELAGFGVDFLAGVNILDGEAARVTVAEGGGVRLFDAAVRYCVVDLGGEEMERLKAEISEVARQRQYLKEEMDAWYAGTRQGSFPRRAELEQLDNRLSALDTRYKRLWDARFGGKPLEMDAQRDAA